ncbi:quinoprotein glucose dehydrogenase [Solimonas aquatica]|uniref:Quinoprotein glucose dehydrogenase n=1 Tax=Solimonas aquatica TaxID=489703 RepID=A0A1H9G0S7_9GAMM|nr:pyrroloquinoline quinone-dependent dehydrogenase [Solimonas aquatica]SEQ43328.1 quinoprotein glucose dehydrogenase [Solimonas aquatica]
MNILSPMCRRCGLFLLLAVLSLAAGAADTDTHQLGTKYSPLAQINTQNVARLQKAWEFHTGEAPPKDVKDALIAFEDQPSLIEGNLVVCTTSRRLIALDPQTGKQRWVFDPKSQKVGMQKCRGITHWQDRRAEAGAACASRIFLGTTDYSLIALDARTGRRCEGFGEQGVVKMQMDKPELFRGEVVAASNPAVVGDVVVVGSAVADNQRVAAPSGRVQAFDARSGALRWRFDPVPREASDPASGSWAPGSAAQHGAGNVWSSMAVDQALDMVYLPTTSPSGDFYGGDRLGDNRYTSSIVALQGSTGKVVWHFQFVHHNIFDYDTPSEPLLIDLPQPDGRVVPALVQNNKTGLIFMFNRATGEPLQPIAERSVPQSTMSGEKAAPTQPFPVGMPTLTPQSFSPEDVWGFTPIDKWLCKRKAQGYRYGTIFTPPSEQGTIFSPSVGGGPNWGGGAYDPASHIMVVPSNRVPTIVTLIPRAKAKLGASQAIESGGAMNFAVAGAPYVTRVEPLLSVLGAPCSAPPWAALTAVDLVKRKIVWEVPLGSIEAMMPMKPPKSLFDANLGTPGAGGPLLTAGGLVFIGYTLDNQLRAFDLKTGKVLWQSELPAAGTAVPVSYEAGGEQYVVITAGGHTMYRSKTSDAVVAYKLKR